MTDTIASARPRVAGIFGSLFRADFTVLVRNGRTMLLNIALPILILFITGAHNTKGAPPTQFGAAVFDIALAVTYGLLSSSLVGYSLTVARDREAGVFQRLRVTPAPTWAIMSSRLLVQIVLDLIMTVIVVVIGTIMHHLALSVPDVVLFGCVSVFGGIVFLAIGQALVGLVRSASAVNAVSRIFYVVLLLLGLLGSTGVLGDTIRTIADWTPVGAMITLYGGVLNLSAWGWTQSQALIACAAYVLIGAFIGIRWFRWDAR